jgi:hypothetical protein
LTKLLIISILFLSNYCYGNAIDRLRTKKQISHFLIRHIDQRFKFIKIFSKNPLAGKDAAKIGFYKTDINNDGRTDLIVNGLFLVAILDKGNNIYQTEYFAGGFFSGSPYLVNIDKSSEQFKIILQRPDKEEYEKPDTVIYKYGIFIENNKERYDNLKLEEIRLYVHGCRMSCPRYNLVIKQDGDTKYYPFMYVPQKKTCSGKFPLEKLDSISEILSYINPDKLRDQYPLPPYHGVAVTFQIKYNGKVKKIEDHSSDGTLGLRYIYEMIEEWVKIANWQ